MANDPLHVLLRVRRIAVDQARQALAECLRSETAANARCEEIEIAIARETAAASDIAADDGAVEFFANWLRRTLPAQSAAAAALTDAETQTREARTVLAAARAGVRAIETMLERKETEQRVARVRSEQLALDEAASVSSR